MSHSFVGPSGAVYFHDGDFGGNIRNDEVDMPFEDMLALVGEWRRRELIAALEAASPEDILKLGIGDL